MTDSNDTYPADAVKRQWDTGVLNAIWIGDIPPSTSCREVPTYLRTWVGWPYLATVIDAHSRRVIGWAIAEHLRTDLVEDALNTRPWKSLGWKTPAEAFNEHLLLIQQSGVASTG